MPSIKEILEIDSIHRYEDVSDDLFTLHDLSNNMTWDYQLPTLMKKINDYSDKKNIIRNNGSFKKKFYEQYQCLQEIDMSNLLIAGGSIRNIIFGNSDSTDIDIFIYGINDLAEGKKRIEKFILDVQKNIQNIHDGTFVKDELKELENEIKKNPTGKNQLVSEFNKKYANKYNPNKSTGISVVSNGNTITILSAYEEIQLILRLYKTKSSILHGFDLGSSAVGFDGKYVYFTTLSKFCYENMVNILDCTRRSTTYESRLIKYFNYGFDIILPNLNIKKLTTKNHKYNLKEVCELPYAVFSYSNLKGNCIQVENFYNNNTGNILISLNEYSDYNIYDMIGIDNEGNPSQLFYFNIKKLLSYITDKSNSLQIVRTIDLNDELQTFISKGQDISNWELQFKETFINPKMLESLYNKLAKEFIYNINLKNIQNLY